MVYSQLNPPPFQSEKVETNDLPVLDKVSLTSVVDFMLKFQEDASFTPPTKEVLFESDKFDISLDDDDEVLTNYSELEDYDEVLDARAKK